MFCEVVPRVQALPQVPAEQVITTVDGGRTWTAPEAVPSSSVQWSFHAYYVSAAPLLIHGGRIILSDGAGVHSRPFAGGAWSLASGITSAAAMTLATGATSSSVWLHPIDAQFVRVVYRSDDGGITFGPPLSTGSYGANGGAAGVLFAVGRVAASYYTGIRFTDPAVPTSLAGSFVGQVFSNTTPYYALDPVVGRDGTVLAITGTGFSADQAPYTLSRIPVGSTAAAATMPIGNGWPYRPSETSYGGDAVLLHNGQFVRVP